jgi:hypothetical protein
MAIGHYHAGATIRLRVVANPWQNGEETALGRVSGSFAAGHDVFK